MRSGCCKASLELFLFQPSLAMSTVPSLTQLIELRFYDPLSIKVGLFLPGIIDFKCGVLRVQGIITLQILLIMAALCNRGPLYFCPVVSFYLSIYLSFFFFLA